MAACTRMSRYSSGGREKLRRVATRRGTPIRIGATSRSQVKRSFGAQPDQARTRASSDSRTAARRALSIGRSILFPRSTVDEGRDTGPRARGRDGVTSFELPDDIRREAQAAWHRYLVLLTPFRPDLHRYCRRLTGDVWDAEDLV